MRTFNLYSQQISFLQYSWFLNTAKIRASTPTLSKIHMELKLAFHTCGFPTVNKKYSTVLPTVLMLYIRSLTTAPFWAIVLSHKCKPRWLSQLGAQEAHLLGGSLKGCVAKCGVQTLPCLGKSWNWERLPDCMTLCWGRGYGEISLSLSYPFLMWVFSHSPDV